MKLLLKWISCFFFNVAIRKFKNYIMAFIIFLLDNADLDNCSRQFREIFLHYALLFWYLYFLCSFSRTPVESPGWSSVSIFSLFFISISICTALCLFFFFVLILLSIYKGLFVLGCCFSMAFWSYRCIFSSLSVSIIVGARRLQFLFFFFRFIIAVFLFLPGSVFLFIFVCVMVWF